MVGVRIRIKMKASSKLKVFLIIFFIAIFAIIAARHFIGLHFKKKFSVIPAPGVIVKQVEKSLFYKSIETFGTAIAQNSKTYRIKTNEVVGKLNIDNRFVKKGEVILSLKNGEEIIADFAGKLGKREIAQGGQTFLDLVRSNILQKFLISRRKDTVAKKRGGKNDK